MNTARILHRNGGAGVLSAVAKGTTSRNGPVAAARGFQTAMPRAAAAATSATDNKANKQPDDDGVSPSSHHHPQPKISNQSVPGAEHEDLLSDAAKEDVRLHNKEFAKQHDHTSAPSSDDIGKKFMNH